MKAKPNGAVIGIEDGMFKAADKLRRLQVESQKELDALMPSILDRAFKGEL